MHGEKPSLFIEVRNNLRWLKKREFMVFIYLSLKYSDKKIAFQDAVFEVKKAFSMTSRTSKNIVKRLIKIGFITKSYDNTMTIRKLEDVFNEYLVEYMYLRGKKRKTYLKNKAQTESESVKS